MNPAATTDAPTRLAFPRYFKFGRYWVNSYKVMLCVGLEIGILTSAALAQQGGLSPLRMGVAGIIIALTGILGARLLFMLTFARHFLKARTWKELWNPRDGGLSSLGSLFTIAPVSLLLAHALNVPAARLWDFMAGGIIAGGFWVRMGCVFNGCCGGRETKSALGICLHDTRWVRKRRIPVQFMEMAWWLLGLAGFFWLWPRGFSPGTYALGVLGWYGFGRFWLEPLREEPDRVAGKVMINRVIAALLVLVGGGGILLNYWMH